VSDASEAARTSEIDGGSDGQAPSSPAPSLPSLPPVDDVRRLFGQLQVRRSVDGKVIIEAPPEAAVTLGALFEGMAALLHSAPRSVPRPQAKASGRRGCLMLIGQDAIM